jgi:hypothetical protein
VSDDWKERVLDAVGDDKEAPKFLVQSVMADEYRPLLIAAAKKRGVPLAVYYRRAVLAFVAHDLGIDFIELAQFEPAIAAEGLTPRKFGGKGFGKWRIGRLDP